MSYGSILAAMCLPQDAYAAGRERFIPDCAGRVEIAHAGVMRVEQDGTLVLPDGRVLLLEGIRLNLADGKVLSSQALAALRAMALAGPVSFTTAAPAKDRYGRIRVQGFGRLWFQAALLEQGLARVQLAPDRDECAPDLYEAEALARDRHAGLWALSNYRVRTPQTLENAAGTFQLVEGRVSNIGRADGRTFVDFGAGSKNQRSLSVVIGAEARHGFRNFDFDALPGRQVRVRGIVQTYRGRPEIVLSNPFQIEVLD